MIGLFILVYFVLYAFSLVWLCAKIEEFESNPFPSAYRFLIYGSTTILAIFATPIVLIFFVLSFLSNLKKSFPDFLRILKYNIKRNWIGDDE